MDLGSIPGEWWNDVLQAYVDTSAVLEVRTIKVKEDTFTIVLSDKDVVNPTTHWPIVERFDFRVQARMPDSEGRTVDEICGELRRWNDGEPGPTFNARLAWDDRFVGWASQVGDDDRHLVVLCGNVIGLSADVVIDRLPMMYEWDRPDAPKDTHRSWRLGRHSDEANADFLERIQAIQTDELL
jgi:hypothetical protein